MLNSIDKVIKFELPSSECGLSASAAYPPQFTVIAQGQNVYSLFFVLPCLALFPAPALVCFALVIASLAFSFAGRITARLWTVHYFFPIFDIIH